ncbi:MAG: cell division protein FtsA [Bdellovibrionales bacterium]
MSAIKVKPVLVAGLDIGSTKVSLAIAAIRPEGHLEIVGLGTAPNTGLKHGIIVNIEATTEAILKAKEEAELMAGYPAPPVWVGVSGGHIKSFDSKGMVAIKEKEVQTSDIQRVIEAAQAVSVPSDRKVLHVLPREYKVDENDGIIDPIGMTGVRLEANVHIVTGGQSALNNIIKCVEKANLKVSGLVLETVASSQVVLSEDEKNLGCCLVDMGGGAVQLLYFVNGSVAHSSMISVGGHHFTHDVAVGLRTPQSAAEELKKRAGSAMPSLMDEHDTIEVEGVGGRKARTIPRKELAVILEARAEEVLHLISHDIRKSGFSPLLGSGVILTGGASQLPGLVEMGEYAMDLPVRKGFARHMGPLVEVSKSAEHATVAGLVQYGYERMKELGLTQNAEIDLSQSWAGLSQKLKGFFKDLF